MKTNKRRMAVLGSALTAALAFGPTIAADPVTADESSTKHTAIMMQDQSQEPDLESVLEKSKTAPADGVIHETNGIRWKVVADNSADDGNAPEFNLGVGRYLYIYLTPRDWNFGSSVGWGGAAGGLCTLAGGGPIGGISCGSIGSALGWYLSDKTGPRGNQCAEIKLRLWAKPFGYKIINKRCSAVR